VTTVKRESNGNAWAKAPVVASLLLGVFGILVTILLAQVNACRVDLRAVESRMVEVQGCDSAKDAQHDEAISTLKERLGVMDRKLDRIGEAVGARRDR